MGKIAAIPMNMISWPLSSQNTGDVRGRGRLGTGGLWPGEVRRQQRGTILTVQVGFTPVADDLYREIILDHYRHPRHRGRVDPADAVVTADNPLCGDQIDLSVRFDGQQVAEIAFDGSGCSISQAASSMLCDEVSGHSRAAARDVARRFRAMLVEEGSSDDLGDLEALQGVRAYPVRVKCATLPCNALLQALGQAEDDT
jgi:nitrogen fixation NifU-like protein